MHWNVYLAVLIPYGLIQIRHNLATIWFWFRFRAPQVRHYVELRISWQCLWFIYRQANGKLRNGFAQVRAASNDLTRGAITDTAGLVGEEEGRGRTTIEHYRGSSCSRLKLERIFHCVVVFHFRWFFALLKLLPSVLVVVAVVVRVPIVVCVVVGAVNYAFDEV